MFVMSADLRAAGAPNEASGSSGPADAATGVSPIRRYTLADWFGRTSIFTILGSRESSRESSRERRARRRARRRALRASPVDALPAPLAQLVRDVVRGTRLRRAERADIALELAAHFADGLESGESVEALHASFGDPRTASRLLRRAARAKRTPFDRAFLGMLRWGSISVAAVVGIYLVSAAWLWFRRPTIAFNATERLASVMPVPEDGVGAWPQYREAMRWATPWRFGTPGERGDAVAGQHLSVVAGDLSRADQEVWREAAAEIVLHRAEIDQLRAAAMQPALGYPVLHTWRQEDGEVLKGEWGKNNPPPVPPPPHEASVFSVLLPQLGVLRESARILGADAAVAADRGEGDRAVDSLIAIFGVARHAGEHGFLVSKLVEAAIRELAVEQIVEILERRPTAFDLANLARLADALGDLRPESFQIGWSTERIGFEDLLQRVFTDDGDGDGVLLMGELAKYAKVKRTIESSSSGLGGETMEQIIGAMSAPAGALWLEGRRDTLARYDAYFQEMDRLAGLPLWEFDYDPEKWFDGRPETSRRRVFTLFAPAADKLIATQKLMISTMQATRVVVALNRFKLERGHWPVGLDELVPAFLRAIPRDPYDGHALRYELREGAPVVWSIGSDRLDDRGVPGTPQGLPDRSAARAWRAPPKHPFAGDSARPAPRAFFGDWIIFDPARPREYVPPSTEPVAIFGG